MSRTPYDIDRIRATKSRLGNILYALVVYNGTMTSSYRYKNYPYECFSFRVHLPSDYKEAFEQYTGVQLHNVPVIVLE